MNTGIFLSEAQLLMSPDLDNVEPDQTDDGYPALSPFAGNRVEDNQKDDRTHKCYPGGRVIAKYISSRQEELIEEISVPEPKVLTIKQIILIEPFIDTGYDHDNNPSTPLFGVTNGTFDYDDLNNNGKHDPGEPCEEYLDISAGLYKKYRRGDHPKIINNGDGRGAITTKSFIDKQVRRANIGWAQAGIKIVFDGSYIEVDENPDPSLNFDILHDGTFDPRGDVHILYNQYKHNLVSSTNIAYVFYTAPFKRRNTNSKTLGVAWYPGCSDSYSGSHYHCYVSGFADIDLKTLAHELGHLMTLEGDAGYHNPHLFFPREAISITQARDITVKYARRLTQDIINKAINNTDLLQ